MSFYAKRMKTILFQRAWSRIFESLSVEKAGALIKAVFSFIDGNDPELSDDVQLEGIYLMMTDQIEESAKKYLSRSGLEEQ